jgi:hypothetical protein
MGITHATVMRAIELLGTEVAPRAREDRGASLFARCARAR